MQDTESRLWSYVLVGALGAAIGGVVVLLVTRALPNMMSQMMSGMMRNMAAQMGEGGCSPAELGKRMMGDLGEVS